MITPDHAHQSGIENRDIRNIRSLIHRDPHNCTAWIKLADLLEDSEQKKDCLRSALEQNPDNENIRARLDALKPPPEIVLPPDWVRDLAEQTGQEVDSEATEVLAVEEQLAAEELPTGENLQIVEELKPITDPPPVNELPVIPAWINELAVEVEELPTRSSEPAEDQYTSQKPASVAQVKAATEVNHPAPAFSFQLKNVDVPRREKRRPAPPEKPLLDKQTVLIHYAFGSPDKKKIAEVIADYTNHGYTLGTAYSTYANSVEYIAMNIFAPRFAQDSSNSTQLEFFRLDPAAIPWLGSYPYKITILPESFKKGDIRCTVTSQSLAESYLVTFPNKVEHQAPWMRVTKKDSGEVIFSSQVMPKEGGAISIDIFEGERGWKICTLKYFQSFFYVHDEKSSLILNMDDFENHGFCLKTINDERVVHATATGFGWYVFNPNNHYCLDERQEKITFAATLAMCEKVFLSNGNFPQVELTR